VFAELENGNNARIITEWLDKFTSAGSEVANSDTIISVTTDYMHKNRFNSDFITAVITKHNNKAEFIQNVQYMK